MNLRQIAVIGAGTMGNGIAHVFAQHGYQVALTDISPEALEKALQRIAGNLDRMIRKEQIHPDDKERTLDRITTFTDLEEGVQ